MTIDADYAPNTFAVNDEREYAFDFPAADDQSIEVYELINVNGTEYRYLVPVQDYTLTWNSPFPRYPLKINGKVNFNRRHSVDTTSVVIERNTLMDQVIDFKRAGAFKTRDIEFAFDKATMICQELAERKCGVSVPSYPAITQDVVFGSYEDIRASEINFAVNKIFTILAEIAASGEDCTDDLEST